MKSSSVTRILVVMLSLLLPLQGMAGVVQFCAESGAAASHESHKHAAHESGAHAGHVHVAVVPERHDDEKLAGACGHCAVSPCCHASGLPVETQPVLAGSPRSVVVLPAMSSQLPTTLPRSGPERPPRFSA